MALVVVPYGRALDATANLSNSTRPSVNQPIGPSRSPGQFALGSTSFLHDDRAEFRAVGRVRPVLAIAYSLPTAREPGHGSGEDSGVVLRDPATGAVLVQARRALATP